METNEPVTPALPLQARRRSSVAPLQLRAHRQSLHSLLLPLVDTPETETPPCTPVEGVSMPAKFGPSSLSEEQVSMSATELSLVVVPPTPTLDSPSGLSSPLSSTPSTASPVDSFSPLSSPSSRKQKLHRTHKSTTSKKHTVDKSKRHQIRLFIQKLVEEHRDLEVKLNQEIDYLEEENEVLREQAQDMANLNMRLNDMIRALAVYKY
jgi:hypothetical protein